MLFEACSYKISPLAPNKGYTAEILRGTLLELHVLTSQMESALKHLEQQHRQQHPEQQDLGQHHQEGQQPYAVAPTDQGTPGKGVMNGIQHQVKPCVQQPVPKTSPAQSLLSPPQSPSNMMPRITAKWNIYNVQDTQSVPHYISIPEAATKTSPAQFPPSSVQPRHQVADFARPDYTPSGDHRPLNSTAQPSPYPAKHSIHVV